MDSPCILNGFPNDFEVIPNKFPIGFTLFPHGLSGFPRDFNGFPLEFGSMGNQIRGLSIQNPFHIHWEPIQRPWGIHRKSFQNPWGIQANSIGNHSKSMRKLIKTHGNPFNITGDPFSNLSKSVGNHWAKFPFTALQYGIFQAAPPKILFFF